ncbi:MAG: hypothetical protein OEL58_05395 [Desulfobacteraceae bacterium]|nr:hypothetical protein [Desulfobacteraceae bacterium]
MRLRFISHEKISECVRSLIRKFLFFDKSADHNLPNGSIITICVGIARMLEKLSERHGMNI